MFGESTREKNGSPQKPRGCAKFLAYFKSPQYMNERAEGEAKGESDFPRSRKNLRKLGFLRPEDEARLPSDSKRRVPIIVEARDTRPPPPPGPQTLFKIPGRQQPNRQNSKAGTMPLRQTPDHRALSRKNP